MWYTKYNVIVNKNVIKNYTSLYLTFAFQDCFNIFAENIWCSVQINMTYFKSLGRYVRNWVVLNIVRVSENFPVIVANWQTLLPGGRRKPKQCLPAGSQRYHSVSTLGSQRARWWERPDLWVDSHSHCCNHLQL